MVRSGRGNGSRHSYALTRDGFRTFKIQTSTENVKVLMPSVERVSKRERETLSEEEIREGYRIRPAWEVALMGEGSQVVLPPSIHPDTGNTYRWELPILKTTDLPLIQIPHSNNRNETIPTIGMKPEAFQAVEVDLGWLPISPEILSGIVDGTGITDRSAFLLRASSALISAGLNENEVLSVLTDPDTFIGGVGYDHAKTKSRTRAAAWVKRYTFRKAKAERDGVTDTGESVFHVPPTRKRKLTFDEMTAQAEEIEEERDWRQDLVKHKTGKAVVCLKNLDLILSHVVSENVFIEDHFASCIEYGCSTPWGGKKKQAIEDIDMTRIKRWLADTEFQMEPNQNALLEVTSLIADRKKVHPVREYLIALVWDGTPRVNTWIRDYCQGDAPEPYLSQISRKFLLAMVKRIFEPGCQWDYVLVLEGKQGKRKSTIARALASDPWFMDNIPDLRDKDSMLNLQGKWLIELAELADVKRADYNQVKAYLVRRFDTVRPHYGRLKKEIPRQSVFIGTINEGQYLKDPTGNRRYWPVSVGECDDTGLKKVRDQLFAEAMHIYRTTDEMLMLDPKATVQAESAQEDRRVDDDESEMRDAFLTFRESEAGKAFPWERFKTKDLMTGVSAPWGAWAGKGYLFHVAANILNQLGFEKVRVRGCRFWKELERVTPG